jgi:hypothetical protein
MKVLTLVPCLVPQFAGALRLEVNDNDCRARLHWLALVLACGLTDACGDPGDTSEPRPDLFACTRAWQTVYRPNDELGLDAGIVYHRNRVFAVDRTTSPFHVISVDPVTRRVSRLLQTWPLEMWAEGDHLMLVHQLDLVSVPVDGGAVTPVVTTGALEKMKQTSADYSAWGLDGEALYWARREFRADPVASLWTFWRGSRDGAATESSPK